jgi:hypothetical protein
MEGFDPAEFQSSILNQQKALERAAAAAETEYHRMQQAQSRGETEAVVEEQEIMPRAATIYEGEVVPVIEDGLCRIGFSTFDISSPEYVIGEPFAILPGRINI